MFSVAILPAILDSQTVYANWAYPIYLLCARPTLRPKNYVSKLISNGVMAVFYVRGRHLGCHLEYFDFPKGARVA